MGLEIRPSTLGIAGARPIVIRRVDVIPVALPLTKPMKMAHLTIRTADNLFVRIESEDGVVGCSQPFDLVGTVEVVTDVRDGLRQHGSLLSRPGFRQAYRGCG